MLKQDKLLNVYNKFNWQFLIKTKDRNFAGKHDHIEIAVHNLVHSSDGNAH